MDSYKIVHKGGSAEISVKKSRFIGTVLPVKTEEEALFFIQQMKKKYWDASHNCSAYVVGYPKAIERCNDDGEPSKTAGKPILDILLGEELYDTAIVVTRYFGGTLLGTGGLVRAYQGAAKEGLANSQILEKCIGQKLEVKTDYNGIGKLQYIAGQLDIPILHTEYTDIVSAILLISPETEGSLHKKMQEATAGKAVLTSLENVHYARSEGELLLFDT